MLAHAAGRVGVWGSRSEFFAVNVGGTRNVIAACQQGGVARLIYTSSPSVVYNGGDLAGVDESAPLCLTAPCHPSITANLNGDEFVRDPDTVLAEHDHLLILSADAGG